MGYREDYYKCTYNFMPHTVFNYGRLFVYKVMSDEAAFLENLKKTWSSIGAEKDRTGCEPPNFEIDIVSFDIENEGIILTIPEAEETAEAAYIGISYDASDDFRYFTYEIDKNCNDKKTYYICEWTPSGEHINYGSSAKRDKNVFIKGISELLIYDLL